MRVIISAVAVYGVKDRAGEKKRWKEAGCLVRARSNRFSPRVIGPLFSDN